MDNFNFTLLGDRVLIKLDEQPTHTVTSSGIVNPLFENYETDGGKLGAKASSRKFLAQGTVVQVSQVAKERMNIQNDPVETPYVLPAVDKGDRVFVTPNASSQNYMFLTDRSQLVSEWDGYICVPHNLIEAKINGN